MLGTVEGDDQVRCQIQPVKLFRCTIDREILAGESSNAQYLCGAKEHPESFHPSCLGHLTTQAAVCAPLRTTFFTDVVFSLSDVGHANLLRKGVCIAPTVQISAEGHALSRTFRRLHVSPAKFPLRTRPFSHSLSAAQKGTHLAICCVHGHAS